MSGVGGLPIPVWTTAAVTDTQGEGRAAVLGRIGCICHRVSDEPGFALPFALLAMLVLSIGSASAYEYTAHGQASTQISANRVSAGAVAEAGLDAAYSILSKPSNNALSSALLPSCAVGGTCLQISVRNGYARYGGTLTVNPVNNVATWELVSTGYVPDETVVSGYASRTVTASATVSPTLTEPANNPAWNYIYATHPPTPGVCDEIVNQSVTIASPFFVSGNLCLQNTASIASGPLDVGGSLTLSQKANAVGSASAPISDAHVAGGCQYWNKPLDAPCKGGPDNVYASLLTGSTVAVPQPVPAWDTWYQNGSPGPYFPCEQASGPVPSFDTSPPDGRNGTYDNLPFNLTPATSYTCKNVNGQLSWNAVTHVLTVAGTIFIDGSAYVSNGAVDTYAGQATLYLSGTFLLKNSSLCAVVNSAGNGCSTTNWNPNQTMLGIIANGSGGQVPSWDGEQLVSADYQGALFATADIDTDTTSTVDGPLCASAINLGQSVNTSFPTVTIVPIGMPGGATIYAQPSALLYTAG